MVGQPQQPINNSKIQSTLHYKVELIKQLFNTDNL